MQSTKYPVWVVIVCIVVLCALFGVALLFNDDGDPGVCLGPDDGPSCSPDGTFCALPAMDARWLVAAPDGGTSSAISALLAAAPGGLCLLI